MTNITVTQRFGRAAAIGVAGLAVALMITVADRHFRADMGFLGCATAGAFLAGLIVARTFGGQGTWGWFCAGFGGARILRPVLAVLLMPFDQGVMRAGPAMMEMIVASGSGPIYVLGMIGGHNWVTEAWIASYSGTQTLALQSNT